MATTVYEKKIGEGGLSPSFAATMLFLKSACVLFSLVIFSQKTLRIAWEPGTDYYGMFHRSPYQAI